MAPTEIHTARLRLIPIEPDDQAVLLALFHQPQVRQYLMDDQLVAPDWVADQISESQGRFATGSLGLMKALPRQGSGQIFGLCGFMPSENPPGLQILYAVAPAHMGQGYAVEMAETMMALARRRLGMTRFIAATDEPNLASIRVLEKLGFTRTGKTPGPAWPQLNFAREDY